MTDARLPVTVLTGFLGAGKTTLLNQLVRQPELAGAAVLINEFGADGVDHLLQVYGADMLRYKGVLRVLGVDQRAVLQGVHMILCHTSVRPVGSGAKTRKRARVHRPQDVFERGLNQCLAA